MNDAMEIFERWDEEQREGSAEEWLRLGNYFRHCGWEDLGGCLHPADPR